MTVITKNIGRLSLLIGEYDSTRSYGKRNRVTLFGSEFESKHDNNNTAPATWDRNDTVTFNEVDWLVVSNGTDAWLAGQDKSYEPENFSGMGRVVLKKHLVEVEEEVEGETVTVTKNLLYQDDFYKDDPENPGQRIPNTNTVFVVKYDFTLAENITVPANCVLEFDGGSLSGVYTITGNNTDIKADAIKIFNTNVIIAESWTNEYWMPEWFGAKGDNITDDTISLQKTFDTIGSLANFGVYKIKFRNNKAVYKTSAPIIIYSQRIAIEGNDATIIKTTDTPASVGNKTSVGGGLYNCNLDAVLLSVDNFVLSYIKDIRLKSTNKTTSIGLFLLNSQKSHLENIFIANCNTGIKFSNAFLTNFINVTCQNCKNGIYADDQRVEGTGGCGTTLQFINCYVAADFGDRPTKGYVLNELGYSSMSCCAADHVSEPYTFNNSDVTVIGCGCETSGRCINAINSRLIFNNFRILQYDNDYPEYTKLIETSNNSYVDINNAAIVSNKPTLADAINGCRIIFKDCSIEYTGTGTDTIHFGDTESSSFVKYIDGYKEKIVFPNYYNNPKSAYYDQRTPFGLRTSFAGKLEKTSQYIKITLGDTNNSKFSDIIRGGSAGGLEINLFNSYDGTDILERGNQLYIKCLGNGWHGYNAIIQRGGSNDNNIGVISYCIKDRIIYLQLGSNVSGSTYYEIIGPYAAVSIEHVDAETVSSETFISIPLKTIKIDGFTLDTGV